MYWLLYTKLRNIFPCSFVELKSIYSKSVHQSGISQSYRLVLGDEVLQIHAREFVCFDLAPVDLDDVSVQRLHHPDVSDHIVREWKEAVVNRSAGIVGCRVIVLIEFVRDFRKYSLLQDVPHFIHDEVLHFLQTQISRRWLALPPPSEIS